MSTWLFSPSLLSTSTASRVSLDLIFVLSRARIAADAIYDNIFCFVSANIRWNATLPAETQSHC